MKNYLVIFLLIPVGVCFLSIFTPVSAQKVTENTRVTLKNSNPDNAESKSFVLSFMRIAQKLVGLALTINLIVIIKRVYEAKGEGMNAVISWFSAILVWLVISQIIIKLMNTPISQ